MKMISFDPGDDLSNESFPDFDEIVPEVALALLLLSENVFMLEVKHEKSSSSVASIFVNANDTFAYACADCEPLPFSECEDSENHQSFKRFYNLVKEHSHLGSIVWLIEKRKMKPISRTINRLKEKNLWKDVYDSYYSPYDKA